jgi:hypothetical protein
LEMTENGSGGITWVLPGVDGAVLSASDWGYKCKLLFDF